MNIPKPSVSTSWSTKKNDRESLIGTEYEYLLHEDDDLSDEGREAK